MIIDNELESELSETLELIDAQIKVIRESAQRMDISAHKICDDRGNYILIPLLTAKAQILSSLALFINE